MHEGACRHRVDRGGGVTHASRIDRIISALWPAGPTGTATTWALLDAARDDRIYTELRLSRLEHICLYAGKLPDALLRAAPYLVELAPTYSFTRPLLETGWGRGWGVFLRVPDPRNLRHHLRSLLRVQDESGRTLVFRYYDPRVLRVYLPTCTPEELATVFGPIGAFMVESEDGEALLEFAIAGRQLVVRRHTLGDPVAA
jgi:hypothetical protein